MNSEPDYADAWREWRRRRLIHWALLGSFVPGMLVMLFAVARPLSRATGIKVDYFFGAIAIAWMLAIAIAKMRWQGFPCPRCQRPMASDWWFKNLSLTKCTNCGLPIGASSSGQGLPH